VGEWSDVEAAAFAERDAAQLAVRDLSDFCAEVGMDERLPSWLRDLASWYADKYGEIIEAADAREERRAGNKS
jgi:hypothetical protein